MNNVKLITEFRTNAETGLSAKEAASRLKQTGPNRIESQKKISALTILLNQFFSPFVLLLAIAAALSFFFGEWPDGIAIIVVIIVNTIIGFLMEFQAERSMESLKELTSVPAKVIRDGKLIEIPSENVVPGDILFVEGGDMITADAQLIYTAQLQTDESALTGESLPIEKNSRSLPPDPVPLAERYNMLFKGTFVTTGNGKAIVTGTGMQTELGAVAQMIQQAHQKATPLEKKINLFSKKLIWITAALVALIFLAGMLNGRNLIQMLETAIALAVAAIPEGLPIVTTLALAFGMLRMVKHHVIVKKLSSVETLGGTNVICTDKTGTLTQNKIEAAFVQIAGNATRIKADPSLNVIKYIDDSDIVTKPAYTHLHRIAALCNTASYDYDGQIEKETGDPLEVGLLKMVFYSDKKPEDYNKQFPLVTEMPFSSETRLMATLHEDGQHFYVAAKGAVEELMARCTSILEGNEVTDFTDKKKEQWMADAEKHAKSGLRMLAFAFSDDAVDKEDFLHDLTFAGLIGFLDPLRPEVPAAIAECRSAGIKVVMITGDHPATAKNIAMQLGLANAQDEVLHGNSMKPYKLLTEEDKMKWLATPVFARVTPAQKLDLIALFQENKMVVGMTGDGVNDAPALKKADIGIAMGQRGTQVAQEVADMILKNDAFSSIVLAIKQGRVIVDNIRRFIIFLLSCNASELLIIATAAILNLHFQLLPLQILFINLVTDVLPALALGVTEAAPDVMQRKPYTFGIAIINVKRWKAIFTYAAVITITTIGAVVVSHEWLHKTEPWDTTLYNNILFYSLIFSQILHVFNMSFEGKKRFYKTAVFRNKYVWLAVISCIVITLSSYFIIPFRKVLTITIYQWGDWVIVAVSAFLSLLLIQIVKRARWVI
jgi:Ca2+-transporting ATPase